MAEELAIFNPQGTQLTLSKRAVKIAKKLVDLNSLVGFPIHPDEIKAWAADCDRLMSYEDLEKLPFILDCFKTTALHYDNNIGIRNIFRSLPLVEKTETGFRILKAIW